VWHIPPRVYRQSIFGFKINIAVKGIHEYEDARSAIENAEGIFTGGGSTLYWSMNYTKQHHDRTS
jgi:peptidase E